ncbi:hypothetical protein FAI40_09325 [Acetobacteraceae bacterium]|nr:hypothetical protein FAI40_09325 [Acetobacteraceae bacterium]
MKIFSKFCLGSVTIALSFSLLSSTAYARHKVGHHVRHLANETQQIQGQGSLDGMMELQRQNDAIRNSITPPAWEADLERKNMALESDRLALNQQKAVLDKQKADIAFENQQTQNSKTTTDSVAGSFNKGRSRMDIYSTNGGSVLPILPQSSAN